MIYKINLDKYKGYESNLFYKGDLRSKDLKLKWNRYEDTFFHMGKYSIEYNKEENEVIVEFELIGNDLQKYKGVVKPLFEVFYEDDDDDDDGKIGNLIKFEVNLIDIKKYRKDKLEKILKIIKDD